MLKRHEDIWLRGVVIVISLGLYVEACRRPGVDGSLGGRPGKVTGLGLLIFGWTEGMLVAIPWLSNFCWLAALVLLARGRLGWALACSGFGLILATGVLLPVPPLQGRLLEAQWWWLASQAFLVAASGLAWFWAMITGPVIADPEFAKSAKSEPID